MAQYVHQLMEAGEGGGVGAGVLLCMCYRASFHYLIVSLQKYKKTCLVLIDSLLVQVSGALASFS
jgi:hypothetical protein